MDENRPSLIGEQVPPARFVTLEDGALHTFSEFEGKPVLLYFWAEWCAYSKPAVAELNEMARKFSKSEDTIERSLVFLAVSIDEADRYERVRERVAYQKLDAVTNSFSGNGLFDEAYQAYRGSDLPHLIFIDPGGKVLAEGHSTGVVDDGLELLRAGAR